MKYKWKYVDGLEPKKKSSTLTRGKVVHEAFERYFKGEKSTDILEFIQTSFRDALKGVSAEDEEEMLLAKYTSLGMVENYPWKEIEEFESVQPEVAFTAKIPSVHGIWFVGRIDGLIKKNGLWWIREVKTTGSGPMEAEKRANVSYQASGYVWGEKEGWPCAPVQGILYDFIFKSRLRKRQTDTATSFGERILEDYRAHMIDPTTGRTLTRSRMYHRYYAYRSASQISMFVDDLVKIAKKIRESKRKNDWVRNPDSCYAFNSACPYLRICFLPRLDKEMVNAYYERRVDVREEATDDNGGK
jgi:hypothetical protein